ncbi:hypothetical protein ONV78_20065 [Hahella sp. CR1]|uniref:hypothetical protein n=1 Tax=Hahella sp. CR1 TaxID=2992807 RepID=UPI002442A7CA|nr:hypothetical protein [Hahella sp. CR1]MDG9670043.1 hypothetical protein [Hahella sp. CR1]
MKLSRTLLCAAMAAGLAGQANAALIELGFEGVVDTVTNGAGSAPYSYADPVTGKIQFDSNSPDLDPVDIVEGPVVVTHGLYLNALTDMKLNINGDNFAFDASKENQIEVTSDTSAALNFNFDVTAWLTSESGTSLKVSFKAPDAFRGMIDYPEYPDYILDALPESGSGGSGIWFTAEAYDNDGELQYTLFTPSNGYINASEFKKVPEPYTATILLMGVAGLAARRLKKV